VRKTHDLLVLLSQIRCRSQSTNRTKIRPTAILSNFPSEWFQKKFHFRNARRLSGGYVIGVTGGLIEFAESSEFGFAFLPHPNPRQVSDCTRPGALEKLTHYPLAILTQRSA